MAEAAVCVPERLARTNAEPAKARAASCAIARIDSDGSAFDRPGRHRVGDGR
jgi:hypothetical protein